MAIVLASSAPVQSPAELKESMVVSFGMLHSFAGQSSSYMKALAEVANFLPPGADKNHKALLDAISHQRLLVMQSCKDVAIFMGTLLAYEYSFIMVLKDLVDVAQDCSIAVQQRNFRAALAGLKRLEREHQKAVDAIERCRGVGKDMQKVDAGAMANAVLAVVQQYTGKEAFQEIASDIQAKMAAKKKAEEAFVESKEKLAKKEGELTESSIELAYYADAAKGEKINAASLSQRSNDFRTRRDDQAIRAANTANHRSGGGWFIFSWSSYDNAGDREQEKADRIARFAQQAKADAELQANKAEVANKRLAVAQGSHQKLTKDLETLSTMDSEATKELERAVTDLKAAQDRAEELSKNFGGMSTRLIAELLGHIQALPERLMNKSAKDGGMFAAMDGYLVQKLVIKDRIEAFLDAKSDAEAVQLYSALTPIIRNAINNSSFVSDRFQPFYQKMQGKVCQLEDLQKQRAAHIQLEGGAADGDAQAAAEPAAKRPRPEGTEVTLTMQADENDEF